MSKHEGVLKANKPLCMPKVKKKFVNKMSCLISSIKGVCQMNDGSVIRSNVTLSPQKMVQITKSR